MYLLVIRLRACGYQWTKSFNAQRTESIVCRRFYY